jgi:mannitol-1-/sugar-/sorbitol-6-phosphatase
MADLPTGRPFAAFLFDMDGTLLNSIASALRAWSRWAETHGVDFEEMRHAMHGMRQADTIRRWGPAGLDIEAEADALTDAEMEDVDDIVAIRGAGAFLAALPADRWALVTSAPRRLALRRIEAAGLPTPQTLVTAEDVAHGKPAPDCFLKGAELLGVAPGDCLVWEDAPAGIAAAEAAGMAVVVVAAAHETPVETAHPTIEGYDALEVLVAPEGTLQLAVRDI